MLPGDSGQGVDRRPTLLRVTIQGRVARTHPGPLPHCSREEGNGRTGTQEGSLDSEGLRGEKTDRPQAPGTQLPSCAMSLLVSTSTRGWAGGWRGGDSHFHPPGLLCSHPNLEAWPPSSKSNQNMCKGVWGVISNLSRARAQDAGRGWQGSWWH